VKRILYVEDNFNNTLLVRRIVQADGHELLSAADAESGWQLALAERPDLILVDLKLPGSASGYDLLRRLKTVPWLNAVPRIVLTAYGDRSAEAAARIAGCDGFLHKPADIQQIRAVLRAYLGQPAVPVQPAPVPFHPLVPAPHG
jgi:CheY-like chemotaxis protein